MANSNNQLPPARKLSDADVAAIVEALEKQLTNRFYVNLGVGIWSAVYKGVIVFLALVAVYGAVGKGSSFKIF